jgi:hypothetical protein
LDNRPRRERQDYPGDSEAIGSISFFLIGPAKDGLGRRCFHWIGDCGFFGTGGNGENGGGEVIDGGGLKVDGF